jgi:hypothetical protein
MKINWGKTILEGLKFGFHPKRWLQIFGIDLIFISLILISILSNLSDIFFILSELEQSPFMIGSLLGYLMIPFILFVIWILVRLWMEGSIIYQSWKTKNSEIQKSWTYACKKYPSLLVAQIIIIILVGLVSMIPYAGWLMGIVITWILFFTFQIIIIKNSGFYEGLSGSYSIFKKNPLEIIIMWLLIAIISSLISIVFAIPLIAMFLGFVFTASEIVPLGFVALIRSQLALLIIGGYIFFIGTSIAKSFSLKTQVGFYLQIKKRFKLF